MGLRLSRALTCAYGNGAVWTHKQLSDVMSCAAAHDHLTVAQWAFNLSATWPPVKLSWCGHNWSAATVAWARSEGCTAEERPEHLDVRYKPPPAAAGTT
eukprot:13504-Heterococcus_DN1.PRE.2